MLTNPFFSTHKKYIEKELFGRYLPLEKIDNCIQKLSPFFKVKTLGYSVEKKPIYLVSFGSGKQQLFLWSQMHGNETTSTKAVFDVLNFFDKNQDHKILNACTIHIIPVLNPDGAKIYSRFNANNVDLNRDASNLSQPESTILRKAFDTIQPDICFNLHGQRTIFSAGNTNNTATLSFLAPAADSSRSITPSRARSMELISAITNKLHKLIPNQIGLYDDTYNSDCVGDTFQQLGIPTVLYEAGHFKDDYSREKVRTLYYTALLEAFNYLTTNDLTGDNNKGYLSLPLNYKNFNDCIIRNAKISKEVTCADIAFQYEEILKDDQISFSPKLVEIGDLSSKFGHFEFDAENNYVLNIDKDELEIGYVNDFVYINDELFALKLRKK